MTSISEVDPQWAGRARQRGLLNASEKSRIIASDAEDQRFYNAEIVTVVRIQDFLEPWSLPVTLIKQELSQQEFAAIEDKGFGYSAIVTAEARQYTLTRQALGRAREPIIQVYGKNFDILSKEEGLLDTLHILPVVGPRTHYSEVEYMLHMYPDRRIRIPATEPVTPAVATELRDLIAERITNFYETFGKR